MAKNAYVAPKVIESLKELEVDGIEVQMDLAEDAWSYGAPPPYGEYSGKLFLDKDGILFGLEDPKDPKSIYVQFNIIAKITEGEYEGTPVYTRVNTKIYRGKNISTMAGLLTKLVADPTKIPSKIGPKKLATLFEMILKKEPVVRFELDWRGAYQYKDKNGDDVYENVYKHYTDFPEDKENGGRKHTIMVTNTHTGGTAEVKAQTQINRFFGKGEKLVIPIVKVSGPVSQTKMAEVPNLVFDEPQVKIHQPTQKNLVEDDDLALILSE